jgi:phage virion morphogenesis protein
MIKITAQTRELETALNRLGKATGNLQPAFASVGEALVSAIQGGLSDSHDPWGNAFAPLKATHGRRVGGQPLMDTRQHIYERITQNSSSNSVEVGMFENEQIGITHQYGSQKRGIPARAFLPIRNGEADLPAAWEAEIVEIFSRHLG